LDFLAMAGETSNRPYDAILRLDAKPDINSFSLGDGCQAFNKKSLGFGSLGPA
jgi:hypothetical protein